jgi:CBS domain-containing protein
VIDFAGESRNRLDLKSAAVLPITDLARWAGLCSGVTCASTTTRISAARDAGKFTTSDAQNLQAAFELVLQLRLGHQVVQMEADQQPDDAIDPHELSSLTRSYLKEAFRAIASVQRRVANELAWAD